MASDLQKIATNYKTVSKVASDLIDEGLVEMNVIDDGRLKKIYTLTPKGTKVSEHLFRAKMELKRLSQDNSQPKE